MPLAAAGRDQWRSRRVGLEPNPIIHRVAEALPTTQVALGRLHRNMPKKELNLLQLTTRLMAKTGTGPPEVVRG